MELGDLAGKIGELFRSRSENMSRISRFVKLFLVLGGATLLGVAHTMELAHSNETFSIWSVVAVGAAVLVLLGGAFVAFTESDASDALESARKAIEDARAESRKVAEKGEAYRQLKSEFDQERQALVKETNRALQLYNSMDVMRGCIEQSLGVPDVTPDIIIQTCLSAACNSLVIAFDFDIKDTWTICVYVARRQQESDKAKLQCIAQARKISCKISDARQWPEGVGVVGVSYSMGNEIIIPDMSAPELATVFNLKDDLVRSYDKDRYQSMVAIPITVDAGGGIWGVVVATSDRAHHFSSDILDGVSTAEPVRAIAAMAALAVKAATVAEPIPSIAAPTPNGPAEAAGHGGDRLLSKIEPDQGTTVKGTRS